MFQPNYYKFFSRGVESLLYSALLIMIVSRALLPVAVLLSKAYGLGVDSTDAFNSSNCRCVSVIKLCRLILLLRLIIS